MPCFPPLHDQQWSQILGATSTNRMPEGDGINGSRVIELVPTCLPQRIIGYASCLANISAHSTPSIATGIPRIVRKSVHRNSCTGNAPFHWLLRCTDGGFAPVTTTGADHDTMHPWGAMTEHMQQRQYRVVHTVSTRFPQSSRYWWHNVDCSNTMRPFHRVARIHYATRSMYSGTEHFCTMLLHLSYNVTPYRR